MKDKSIYGCRYAIIVPVIVLLVIIEILMIVWISTTDNNFATNLTQVSEDVEKIEGKQQNAAGSDVAMASVSTSGWDLDKVSIVNDTAGIPVPVPKGYVASGIDGEHTVNSGFVIYEGTESVTASNKSVAQATRNQWVWVPIYNISEIYGTDSSGKRHGKLYSYDSSGRTALNWTENNGVMSITNATNFREPDVLGNSSTSYDRDEYMPNYISEETRNELKEEMQIEFEETIESIEKYGGFYIGRYETGGLNGNAKIVKGDTNIASQTWYTMYEKSKTLNGENKNVKTNMIWGCLWDATLEWLVDSGSKTYSLVGSDSTSWGNYYNNSITYINENGNSATTTTNSSTRIPSGSSESTKANNIYDMAGNVLDWTLEASGTYGRVLRGGYYGYGGGGGDPAGGRGSNSPSVSVTVCRR